MPTHGFWIMASHGRPERAIEVCRRMRKHGAQGRIVIGLNDDLKMFNRYMEALAAVDDAPDVEIMKVKKATCSADVYRHIYGIVKRKNVDWLGVTADDVWPETDGFEQELVATAKEMRGIASGNDNWQAPKRMHGAIVFDGDFLRDLGFLAPEGFTHMYVDDVWESVGNILRCWKVRMDIMTVHAHPARNLAARDEVYEKNDRDLAAGRERFEAWVRDERMDIINRIGPSYGVRIRPLEVNGMSITIALPSHDQKLFLDTSMALGHSMCALMNNGVKFNISTMPGDSMVARARNSLISSWYREMDTEYLMFIDTDMGWNPNDMIRLLMDAKVGDYDVVAAIGRRKTDESESYCYLMFDDNRAMVDPKTGCFEVRSVGAAFMLISRRIVQKMIESFGDEVDYIHTDGKLYWELFWNGRMPDRHYWSEDYTFCDLVRKVGSRVMVNPHIALTHWGTKGWYGALSKSGQIAEAPLPADDKAA